MVTILKEYGVERMIINSAADWGVSDPLMVPKTIAKMRQAGFEQPAIDRLVWENPVGFFEQSGRLAAASLAEPTAIDRQETYSGNTVLRGQRP